MDAFHPAPSTPSSPRGVDPAFSVLIRRRRRALGLAEHELAVATKVHPSVIRHYELGRLRRLPAPDVLRALAVALDLDLPVLLAAAFGQEAAG